MVEILALSYAARINSVQVWDHYLAYTVENERLVVCDLDTGLVTTVASSDDDPTMALVGPIGSKDTVVYVRHSTPEDPEIVGRDWMTWRLEALDLRTGTRWVLDRSSDDEHAADTKLGPVPSPDVEWPWVVWQHPVDDEHAELWSFDLRADQATVVASFPNVGLLDLTEGRVVYDHRVGDDRRDLYLVPADGSREPERLTEMQGQWPNASGDLVAWDDLVARATLKPDPPADPTIPPFTPAQYDTWAYSLAERGEPVRLGPGSGARAGDGFVLATTDETLVLYDPDRPGEPPVELEGVSSSALVWRDYVVSADGEVGTNTRTLRLLRIVRRGQ